MAARWVPPTIRCLDATATAGVQEACGLQAGVPAGRHGVWIQQGAPKCPRYCPGVSSKRYCRPCSGPGAELQDRRWPAGRCPIWLTGHSDPEPDVSTGTRHSQEQGQLGSSLAEQLASQDRDRAVSSLGATAAIEEQHECRWPTAGAAHAPSIVGTVMPSLDREHEAGVQKVAIPAHLHLHLQIPQSTC